MDTLMELRDTLALYYQTNTELALWASIAVIATIFLLIMLASPAFRRFMAVVVVISGVLITLLINFGEEVVRGL